MKSLTRIITALIVFNLATRGYVLAQESRPEELRQAQQYILAQKQADVAAADAQARTDLLVQQGYMLPAVDQTKRGSTERVLLVLTSPTKSEDLAMIIEDLNIMSRILDKKIGRAQDSKIALLGDYIRLDNLLRGSHGTAQTQATYVQGYAALFFISVDFPLSPAPEVQAEKVTEGTDQVWEQTKWQMAGSNRPVEYMHQRDAAARQYDKDVVEQLKTDLVKTLKHAANIRNLKADEWIILVIAGTRPGLVVAEEGAEPYRYRYILSDPATKGAGAPSILTIRAKKADIDAYSTGKMTDDQFRQRALAFTGASSSAVEARRMLWSSINRR